VTVKCKKEEVIELGRNFIEKYFMVCTAYQIVFGIRNEGE